MPNRPTEITEGRLVLTFDANWVALKWDEHDAYRRGLQRFQHTAAVDVLAVLHDDILWLFELKDPRDHRVAYRPQRAELDVTVANKVRDTFAALAWAHGRGFDDPTVARYLRHLAAVRDGRKVVVVLWLEDADEAQALAFKEQLQRNLKWLNPRVIVTNQRLLTPEVIPGLTVANRPNPPPAP
jgi:hypothetical protein